MLVCNCCNIYNIPGSNETVIFKTPAFCLLSNSAITRIEQRTTVVRQSRAATQLACGSHSTLVSCWRSMFIQLKLNLPMSMSLRLLIFNLLAVVVYLERLSQSYRYVHVVKWFGLTIRVVNITCIDHGWHVKKLNKRYLLVMSDNLHLVRKFLPPLAINTSSKENSTLYTRGKNGISIVIKATAHTQ